jgi:putative oxidoreductase
MSQLTHVSDEEWAADPAGGVADATASPLARVRAFLLGPYPTLISRLVLGGVFLLAGLTKLGVPQAFVASIQSYEMPLPDALVQAMAVGLPIIEVVVGAWLLLGLFTRVAAAVCGGLMVVFLIAMFQAMARGLDPDCGCFSGPSGNPIGLAVIHAMGPLGNFLTQERVGLGTIIRDGILLLMAVHLVLVPTIFALDSAWRRYRQGAETELVEAEA